MLVISGQWEGDKVRLCALESLLGLIEQISASGYQTRDNEISRPVLNVLCYRSSNCDWWHMYKMHQSPTHLLSKAVSDCSVTERRRWRPPNRTGKTVHVQARHYKHDKDRITAPGVCGNGSVPLSHTGNVVTRIGIHTYTHSFALMVKV